MELTNTKFPGHWARTRFRVNNGSYDCCKPFTTVPAKKEWNKIVEFFSQFLLNSRIAGELCTIWFLFKGVYSLYRYLPISYHFSHSLLWFCTIWLNCFFFDCKPQSTKDYYRISQILLLTDFLWHKKQLRRRCHLWFYQYGSY